MGIGARVLVVEANHVSNGDERVGDAVDPCAAILFHRERIAHGVDHFALADAAPREFPESSLMPMP